MNIASARALKEELKSSVLAPLMETAMQPERFAVAAMAVRPSTAGQQRTLALGIVPKGNGQALLAIRVQRRALMPDAERISARARGEADIRYIGRVQKRARPWYQTRQRPLVPGISIGHYAITAGTLGCFVWRGRSKAARVLSNNHVLANENDGERGDDIVQSGTYDGGRRPKDVVGSLDKFVRLKAGQANLVDCATASINGGIEISPQTIKGIGRLSGVLPFVEEGIAVHKLGRTTGLTHGRVTAIELDDVVVAFDQGNLSFDNQIEIEGDGNRPFSDGGDSGSLIVDDDVRAVGLLFAGGDQGGRNGRGLTYANSIGTVLDQLGAQLLI